MGTTSTLNTDKVYLYKVAHEKMEYYHVLDSCTVKNGKFSFKMAAVPAQILYLGTSKYKQGGYLFWEPQVVTVRPKKIEPNRIEWDVTGSSLDKKYRTYKHEQDIAINQQVLDSLTIAFYAARKKNDNDEMQRVSEQYAAEFDKSKIKLYDFYPSWIKENADNLFGPYVYFMQEFVDRTFAYAENIEKERQSLKKRFRGKAKESFYYKKMTKQLDELEKSVVGAIAPEIIGTDTLGNTVKLSDFRGKYVIVDFWNSYCGYCREETPNLLKALELYSDKGLAILGVSSDFIKDHWMKAIHEDGSYWPHLLLNKGNNIMSKYGIKGIPYIILLDPNGKILHTGLRGKKIISIPGKYLK